MPELDVLKRALASVVAAETGRDVCERSEWIERVAMQDTVEARVEFAGPVTGRLVVTLPRSLLGPLFAARLPGECGAEVELVAAVETLAIEICERVLQLRYAVDDFDLAPPVVSAGSVAARPEIAIGVLGGWVAAELAEDSITRLRAAGAP